MANLPDLNTAEIGIISFWCSHDHRATTGATIDPSDVIDILDSYTLYDNGVDGTYTKNPRGTVNVRVKNDGWIIAWVDRTNEYALDINSGDWHYNGYYDILYNWKASDSNISSDTNTLIEVVADLYNDLSNSGDFNFSKEDVGTFCYEFPDASVFSLASSYMYFSNGSNSEYMKFTITSGVSLLYLAINGSMSNDPNGSSSGAVDYQYNDTTLGGFAGAYGGKKMGVYDVVDNNAYEKDQTLSVYLHGSNDGYTDYYSGALLAIWV